MNDAKLPWQVRLIGCLIAGALVGAIGQAIGATWQGSVLVAFAMGALICWL